MFWDGKKNRGNRKERGDPRALPAAPSRWYNPHMHFAIDWPQGLEDVIKLFIAYFLALPVGWYREREAHSVGVRTFPVVAMASCGYVLLGTPSDHMSIEAQSLSLIHISEP